MSITRTPERAQDEGRGRGEHRRRFAQALAMPNMPIAMGMLPQGQQPCAAE